MNEEFQPLDTASDEPILVVPLGEFPGEDGTVHVIDDDNLRELFDATDDEEPILVDYNHDSLQGGSSEAAGWISSLELRDDGLYAQISWTDRGRASVDGGEYRYLSPAFAMAPV